MDERTETRIEGWDSKPLTGGFAELRELADGGFSGAARAGTTKLFMLNGKVVGVFGGTIQDFDGAEGTVYQAPHPSLPLLFAMQEHGGEQQAKNYTKDTPISAAHDQLEDAGFTGYIELSENVLSGDYYVVFYGGRAMSCAFVGNSGRLETGDEAFQLADDEVGIYEVVSVDIEVTDIPESSEGTSGGAAGGSASGGDSVAGDDTGTGVQPDDHVDQTAQPPAGGQGGGQSSGGTADQPSAGSQQPQDGNQKPTDTPQSSEDAITGVDDAAGEEHAASGADASGGVSEDPTGPESAPGDPSRDATRPDSAGESRGEESVAPDRQADAEAGASEDVAAGTSEPDDQDGNRTAPEGERRPGADRQPDAGQQPDADHRQPDADRQSAGTDRADRAGADAAAGGEDSAGGPAPREEAAADRAVEAASGPGGSAVTGAATASEGVPKSQAGLSDLRPVPSLSPDDTRVADPGEEAVTRADDATQAETSAESRSGGGATDGPSGGRDATAGQDSGGGGAAGRASGDASGGDRPVGSERPRSGGGTDVTERASQAVDVDVEGGTEPVPEDASADELRRQLAAREERIEELETAITDLRVQRDGLTDERDRLESEVERLEAEVADLESEVERLRSELSDDAAGTQRLSREDALQGTNLFVRYGSKSGGTLDKAHGGEVAAEEVNENLRLEHHTQFDADDVVVEDQPFGEFLGGTIYRGFVEWVVRELLYEIQDTGHVKQLQDLYDAVPQIDRAELLGDVSVQFTEDGEQYREQRSFDVVLRDRMGNPLVVANINDSRNPADREMMETVIENGIDVKESNESLAAAMMVTASFFKPGALEAADEAHSGSLIGRDSKESYVKLNRKSGYHLMLVESRGDDFHVNVPEL